MGDAGVASMQVDPQPTGPSRDVNLKIVARIGWVAAVLGLPSLAEACAKRAASAQVKWCLAVILSCCNPLALTLVKSHTQNECMDA